MKIPALALFGLCTLLFCVSCASTKPTSTSFLANQDQLKEEGKVRSYTSPKLATPDYKKVYIAPVELQLEKEAFSEEQRADLVTYYETELKTAFGSQFELVTSPTSSAYTVRSAITGLNSVSVVANAVLAVVAVPLDNGGASVETEFLDGASQERLYAESRSLAGGLTGKGSFTSKTLGYLSKTSHAKACLKIVAEELAKTLGSDPEEATAEAN